MTKQLYIVSVGFEYAVLAEDEAEALRAKEDVLRDDSQPTTSVHLAVSNGRTIRPRGWTDDCLVYGAPYGTDVRLDDAITIEMNRRVQENLDAEALRAQQALFPTLPKKKL